MNKDNEHGKSLSEVLPESIFTAVHEAIGEASMCWENVSGAGVFDAERASEIARRLCWSIVNNKADLCKGMSSSKI
jgi:hypothetical protein